jgi:hypothetical protein
VTFYRSPVTLSHCRWLDTTAPAALYVAETEFECEVCEFGRVSAQALHIRYAEGRVSSGKFHDVLGNAIAARGSRIEVHDLSLVRAYDPGILAEQNSVVTVRGGYGEDVGVAVASSDGSFVWIEDALLRRVGTAGLVAYAGASGRPASIHASSVTFENKRAVQSLVQPGSSVRLEGLSASTKPFDVDRLSWRQGITTTIRPLGYRLGPSIWLAGYTVVHPEIAPGDPLQVTLYWHNTAPLDHDYTIFVHIRDSANEMVAGHDTMPRQNSYPTTAWQAGQTIDDPHVVPLDLGAGEYQIALGMYNLANGQRLPVYGLDEKPLADATIHLDSFRVTE